MDRSGDRLSHETTVAPHRGPWRIDAIGMDF
jgi:hypothetical protein